MKSIKFGLRTLLHKAVPELDSAHLPGQPTGKLRLSPERALVAIQVLALAEWVLA